jgi:hypothetical protein
VCTFRLVWATANGRDPIPFVFALFFRVAPRVCCFITRTTWSLAPETHPIARYIHAESLIALSLAICRFPFVILVRDDWRLVLSTANNAQPTDPHPQNVPGNHSEFGFDSHNLDSNIAVLAFPSESQLPISAGMAGNSYDPTAYAIVSVVDPCVPPCRRQFNLRTILLRRLLKSNALFPTG